MSAIADLDRLIAAAIARNATILRGDRMLEALLDDSGELAPDLIPTGRAMAALRMAHEAAPDRPLSADQLADIHRARADLRRRLRA